ncbi:MAG: radical SAM family heme chaperone HemW [Spirochaetaceae bacterium]|nr:radical SAM family heme chaperone HemW [Spirochaetaceae bacterium]
MANLSNLSLYFHIPFCVKRCRYCDFYSVTGAGRETLSKTLDTLIQSLDKSLSILNPKAFPTVFIGGGTPSLIPMDLLDRFLFRVKSRIKDTVEFTIEANPESLSREFLEVISSHGVNRISMGVQSYDEKLLSWLGRPAGRAAVDRADRLLAEFWKGRLSRDLLAGLPGISGKSRLLDDIQQALLGNPGHLSLYELTVEEGTALAGSIEDLKSLPDESVSFEEWKSAVVFLEKLGYQRYEISNFAQKGEESLHNLKYWRMQPYLGVGPGAASTFPAAISRVVRRQEPRNLSTWLSNPENSFSEELLTSGELALEHFMMGLRTSEGISIRRFKSIFGISPVDAAAEAIKRWTAAGMLVSDSESIRPTAEGMELLDMVLADIAAEADKIDWSRFCRWPQS